MKKLLTTTAIVAGALLFASAAQADIIITAGNHPQANEANILFEASETDATLDHGEVDHSGAGVTFDSLTLQHLTQQAKGQADIFCATNCVDNGIAKRNQLTSIEMKAGLDADGNPTAWTDAIINLDFGVGTALIEVTDNFGETFSLKNGSNFFTMVAGLNGLGQQEFITDIKVTNANPGEAFGFNSFKQPRVSGLCTLVTETSCTSIPVSAPEPASLLALGVGLLGLAAVRRRS